MSFTKDNVAKVARLARIRLSEEETAHYVKEMGSILSWIEQLQAVNTDGIEPLLSVSNQTLPWRDDVVSDGQLRNQVLSQAPMQNFGCFVVPKVVE